MTENYEFDALRTFIFYQFREWKLAEPPYEVSIVGRKDAPWTQIKTDREHLWGLKIIKS